MSEKLSHFVLCIEKVTNTRKFKRANKKNPFHELWKSGMFQTRFIAFNFFESHMIRDFLTYALILFSLQSHGSFSKSHSLFHRSCSSEYILADRTIRFENCFLVFLGIKFLIFGIRRFLGALWLKQKFGTNINFLNLRPGSSAWAVRRLEMVEKPRNAVHLSVLKLLKWSIIL